MIHWTAASADDDDAAGVVVDSGTQFSLPFSTFALQKKSTRRMAVLVIVVVVPLQQHNR